MTDFTPQEEKIYGILSDILVKEFEIPAEKIAPDARLYEDFDIDSIDAVDMIVQLKPHLGNRRVTPEAFKQVRTMGDVVRVVASILEEPEKA
ncbi:acyl carrier protein [Sutterella sp.]|uniref:acyl carrier protein n=1 Tax=Sutterella sp. TaxID=1981025 RepID=UPI0026DFD07F|nr:acyl carrier protein [Sutterella sp.]MDO5530948.1 acyl carrier protein [Sutterella sp.]